MLHHAPADNAKFQPAHIFFRLKLKCRQFETAIDRLHDDFERVEFWAAMLTAFMQPVPTYQAPDSEHLLRRREEPGEDGPEATHHGASSPPETAFRGGGFDLPTSRKI